MSHPLRRISSSYPKDLTRAFAPSVIGHINAMRYAMSRHVTQQAIQRFVSSVPKGHPGHLRILYVTVMDIDGSD